MITLVDIGKKLVGNLYDSAPQMPRLVAMRKARESKCVCTRCRDLVSRIHYDGALTKHAHSVEKEGVGFWTDSLPEVYVPEFKPEPDSDCQLDPNCSFQYVTVGNRADARSGSDKYWVEHYENLMSSIERWHHEQDEQ